MAGASRDTHSRSTKTTSPPFPFGGDGRGICRDECVKRMRGQHSGWKTASWGRRPYAWRYEWVLAGAVGLDLEGRGVPLVESNPHKSITEQLTRLYISAAKSTFVPDNTII